MSDGAELIAAERRRQVEIEGMTAEHDDGHDARALTRAAECYLCWGDAKSGENLDLSADELIADIWPWASSDWKPSEDPVRNLVKAGALIAAEIDRLQRAGSDSGDGKE